MKRKTNATLGILVVIVFTLVVTFLRSEQFQGFLLKHAIGRISPHYEVRFENLGFSIGGHTWITNLTLCSKTNRDTLLKARQVSMDVDLISLVQKNLSISNLKVNDLDLHIKTTQKTSDGLKWNANDFPELTISQAHITKGNIHIINENGTTSLKNISLTLDEVVLTPEVREITLSSGSLQLPAPYPELSELQASLKNKSPNGKWFINTLHLKTKSGSELTTKGSIDLMQKGSYRYVFENTQAHIEYEDVARIKDLDTIPSLDVRAHRIQGNLEKWNVKKLHIQSKYAQLSTRLEVQRKGKKYTVSLQNLKLQTVNTRKTLGLFATVPQKMHLPNKAYISGFANYTSGKDLLFSLEIKNDPEGSARIKWTGQGDFSDPKKYYAFGNLSYENIALHHLIDKADKASKLKPLHGNIVMDAEWTSAKNYKINLHLQSQRTAYGKIKIPRFSLYGTINPDIYTIKLQTPGKNSKVSMHAVAQKSKDGYALSWDVSTDTLNLYRMGNAPDKKARVKLQARSALLIDTTGTISYLDMEVKNLYYADKNFKDSTDRITLRYHTDNTQRKYLTLEDPKNVSLQATGILSIDSLRFMAQKALHTLLTKQTFEYLERHSLSLNLKLHHSAWLRYFYPDLQISPNTQLNCKLSREDSFLQLFSPKVDWGDFSGSNVSLWLGTDTLIDHLISVDSLAMNAYTIPKVLLRSGHEMNHLLPEIFFKDFNGNELGHMRFSYAVNQEGLWTLNMDSSYLNIRGKVWDLFTKHDRKKLATIHTSDDKRIALEKLFLRHDDQQISVEGQANLSQQSFQLKLDTRAVQLAYFLPKSEHALEGVLNQKLEYAQTKESTELLSQSQLSRLKINGIALPDLILGIKKSPSVPAASLSLILNGNLASQGWLISQEEWAFDHLSVKATQLPVRFLELVVPPDALSDFKGAMDLELTLDGSLRSPEVDAEMTLSQTGFRVSYLNTTYSFPDGMKLYLDNEKLRIPEITFRDQNKNNGRVRGIFKHKNFTDLQYLIDINTDNTLFLNTDAQDQPDYYGQAAIKGQVSVTGTTDAVAVKSNGATIVSAVLNIPLSGTTTKKHHVFFFKKRLNTSTEKDLQTLNSNIKFDVSLDKISLSPSCKIRIIPSQEKSDLLEVKGAGTFSMHVSDGSPLSLAGDYVIYEGTYDFTLTEIVGLSKVFQLEKGGVIHWNGSPYDPTVSIKGSHFLRSSLSAYLNNPSYSVSSDISLDIDLEGKVSSLDLKPSIHILNATSEVALEFSQKMISQEEVYTQFFSLLTLGSFTRQDTDNASTQQTSQYGKALTALLFNNLYSIILDQEESQKLNVSFSHNQANNTPTTADQINQNEWEVNLQSKLWDNRLILNGILGIDISTPASGVQNQDRSSLGLDEASLNWKLNDSQELRIFHKRSWLSTDTKTSVYKQGIGFYFEKNFDHFLELFRSEK